MKIDIIKKDNKTITHQQIELRDGLVFMRLKRRGFEKNAYH